jgi:uncharacterized protein (TIGR02145 family)
MRFLILSCLLCAAIAASAQVPALIPYQAIARDAAGQPLANTNINARFTIHDATSSGAVVWQEIQTVSTTSLGLFTVQLGSAVPLTDVNWASGNKFMQVEVDFGAGFTDVGTQQMLSVPFALHSGNGFTGISISGDTLHFGNGQFAIINGISATNNGPQHPRVIYNHTCGTPNVHNPILTYGTLTDQEGNSYNTIVIGTQEWMAENLNTSIYRNGDPIPYLMDNAEWSVTTDGAYGIYDGNVNYTCPYGKLYNWYACVDERELCPIGWHYPTETDWIELTNFVGNEPGVSLRSIVNWGGPNILPADADNRLGFSGLPAGARAFNGNYGSIGINLNFWGANETSNSDAAFRYLSNSNYQINQGTVDKHYGMSVRCVRD